MSPLTKNTKGISTGECLEGWEHGIVAGTHSNQVSKLNKWLQMQVTVGDSTRSSAHRIPAHPCQLQGLPQMGSANLQCLMITHIQLAQLSGIVRRYTNLSISGDCPEENKQGWGGVGWAWL